MKRTSLIALVTGAVVVAGGVTAGAVALTGDDEVGERGSCAATTHELTVERDDDTGGLEVGFELQSAGPGEVWSIDVRQGDAQLFAGERTTDEDGEVDLDLPAAERDGDLFTVEYAAPDAGEPCTVTVRR
ncbi:hypothetical protein [Nocardioides perillae]|uniref:Uncharacterized protein n=1 Tax=Nocardioides perillae TaxID=1119534 RepID=A0A7Y9RS50_9ACTN|nr:hypothetical protein [Nocardioides perillae]NYG55612.1 hypothetical protein [Nocardioides perillae]